MSAIATKMNPPAYEQLELSESASQIFMDRIQATIEAEYTNPNEEPAETKRLRNFLLYCLAIDYRMSCPLVLSASDREHFLSMHKVLDELSEVRRHMHFTAGERRGLAPYLWKYLHAPCASLRIPVECAVIILARYTKFLNPYDRYKGCVHGVLNTYGPRRLANKLSMDRSVLVPLLATSSQMRLELTEKITGTA